MEIKMMDGDLVYTKKDGSKSKKPVAVMKKLEYLGFTIPRRNHTKYAQIISGNLISDRILLIRACASNWVNNYIISKDSDEVISVPHECIDEVKSEFEKNFPTDLESAEKRLEKIENA